MFGFRTPLLRASKSGSPRFPVADYDKLREKPDYTLQPISSLKQIIGSLRIVVSREQAEAYLQNPFQAPIAGIVTPERLSEAGRSESNIWGLDK